MWSSPTTKERKVLVIFEIVKIEDELYKVKAVRQQQQGNRTTWEEVVNWELSCNDHRRGLVPS